MKRKTKPQSQFLHGSRRGKGRPKGTTKPLSPKEKAWADLMIETGIGCIAAARKVFGWKCEPGSKQSRQAIELTKATRIRNYIAQREEQIVQEIEVSQVFNKSDETNWDKLRRFCYKTLKQIRDNPTKPARHRYNAAMALEKLSDPSADTNLIMRWINIVWGGLQAHCPCCHSTFPLWKVNNYQLNEWRKEENIDPPEENAETTLDLRLHLLHLMDKGKTPHKSQIIALQAEERHIVALAPARSGKSYILAGLATLQWLVPGSEIWILAKNYSTARSEIEFFKKFIQTLFYPYYKNVIESEVEDAKAGELIVRSRWKSEIRVVSAASKGSIVGRELDLALVAEPGWVDEGVLNHLRARMVSRLGRILMFGTPQGFQGVLGRFINLTGRDRKGKITRIPPDKRTLASGCPWNVSLLKYQMDPTDNPEYVQSELDAARLELTDAEYASEFEGLMASAEGAKFPHITPDHIIRIPPYKLQECVYVLGIDQGPKNFAAVLLGYDNRKIYVIKEFFESQPRTMKSNLEVLYQQVPRWLKFMGCDPSQWLLTIFDAAPLIHNELLEMEEEGKAWPTETTFRPAERANLSWRPDTYEFINALAAAKDPNLLFDLECDLLHDQLMRAQNRPDNRDIDAKNSNKKGWIITDAWRGDHVVDAFVMAVYTIAIGSLMKPDKMPTPGDPFSEAKAAFDYMVAKSEQDELSGFNRGRSLSPSEDGALFEKHFGRPRGSPYSGLMTGLPGYYRDES